MPDTSRAPHKEPPNKKKHLTAYDDEIDDLVRKVDHKTKRRSSVSPAHPAPNATKAKPDGPKRRASIARIHPGATPRDPHALVDTIKSGSSAESKDSTLAV